MPPQHDFENRFLSLSNASSAICYRGVECLPPEILSHIFIIGSDKLGYEGFEYGGDKTADDDDDDDNDDDDNGDGAKYIYFATLCSHVCQYWRNVAINTCQLWSYLDFKESPPLERSKVWIARSKDVPLAIRVDLTTNEPSYSVERKAHTFREVLRTREILDLLMPHVYRWKMFELIADSYDLIWLWQKALVQLRSAPILQHFGVYCHEDWTNEDVFHPQELRSPMVLFPQGTPNIRSVILWGVHLNWELTTLFAGLENLQLAWHTKDVRFTTEQFVQALNQSPKLDTLSLEGSAPLPGIWPRERILLPNLQRFSIMHIDVNDAISVVDHIDFPVLTALNLDLEGFEADDAKRFIRAVCQPNKPRFEPIQSLMLISFNCSRADGKLFLSTMLNVKVMILNFNFLPKHFHDSLTSHSPFLCPRLETLRLSGLESKHLKSLIKARQKSPTRIQRLYLDADDDVSESTIQWLRGEVEKVKFFENSDVEDDEDDEEEEEEEEEEEGNEESDESEESESDDGGSEEA